MKVYFCLCLFFVEVNRIKSYNLYMISITHWCILGTTEIPKLLNRGIIKNSVEKKINIMSLGKIFSFWCCLLIIIHRFINYEAENSLHKQY